MTTLSRETGIAIALPEVKKELREQLTQIFDRPFAPLSKEYVHDILHPPSADRQTEMAHNGVCPPGRSMRRFASC